MGPARRQTAAPTAAHGGVGISCDQWRRHRPKLDGPPFSFIRVFFGSFCVCVCLCLFGVLRDLFLLLFFSLTHPCVFCADALTTGCHPLDNITRPMATNGGRRLKRPHHYPCPFCRWGSKELPPSPPFCCGRLESVAFNLRTDCGAAGSVKKKIMIIKRFIRGYTRSLMISVCVCLFVREAPDPMAAIFLLCLCVCVCVCVCVCGNR